MSFRQFISLIGILVVCLCVPGRASANRIEATSVQVVFSPNQNVSSLHIGRVSNYYFPVADLEIATSGQSQPSTPKSNLESDSLLSGVGFYALAQDPQKQTAGTVEVAICDCGDVTMPIAAGGFPKWPLLFLAGVPFFFITGGEDVLPPLPGPIPTLTPTLNVVPTQTVPEPASLLLLLGGVCAVGFRLRRSRTGNRE
jgi:PEP-CTERM motif-containing protein